MATRVPVASIADIQEGDYLSLRVNDLSVLIGLADGRYFALEDQCPHARSALAGGSLSGREITCPRHGAVFDVLTGSAVYPGGLPPIRTFDVEAEGGRLHIWI